MCPHDSKPEPGEMVLLKSIPPGLVDGLPQDDQNAIVAIIGKPVLLVGKRDERGGTATRIVLLSVVWSLERRSAATGLRSGTSPAESNQN